MLVLIRWQWRDLAAGIAGRAFRIGAGLVRPRRRRALCDRWRHHGPHPGDPSREAVLLNNAATIGDLSLATAQLVLVMFSLISFGLDGYAHAAEALVGEAIGERNLPMLNLRGAAHQHSCRHLGGGHQHPRMGRRSADHRHADHRGRPRRHDAGALALGGDARTGGRIAFQMDGIFIGATRSREMRNAMIVSFAGFLLVVLVAADYGLNGLLAAFTIYLGLRGITLMMRMRACPCHGDAR